MRRIVIAPDKFKGSLSAHGAASAMARGFARVFPAGQIDTVPVADGGDGTAETLARSLGGRMVEHTVRGPDGSPVRAHYGLVDAARLAIVELAQASGLSLLPRGRNDPLTATTYGTGELVAAAIEAGARRIILAIGGSATNDAGTGALSALGAVFASKSGKPIAPGGAALAGLASIDVSALDRRLKGVSIEIASDVRNPLCGPLGASAVYGPQKGASPEDVLKLDAALSHFADVVAKSTGVDVRDIPGAGAAGGTGAGFLALAKATQRPGAQLVLDVLDFPRHLEGAELVVTGEGRLDVQTLEGKAPFAVAQAARALGIPAVAIAGSVGCSREELERAGIAFALSIEPGPVTVEEAMRRADEFVATAAETLARALTLLS